MVVSGQHSVLALRRRAADYEREGLTAPDLLLAVSAVVLRPDTPLKIRELAAGDAQAAQGLVRDLTIPEFTRLLLTEWGRDKTAGAQARQRRLMLAYHKSGWRRNVSPV